MYKTSRRNALRTLNNTCDHRYDIVITEEKNTQCASSNFLNGNFGILPFLESFSTVVAFTLNYG